MTLVVGTGRLSPRDVGHGGGYGETETAVTEAVCARYMRRLWKEGIV